MKITIKKIPKISIDKFADEHRLELVITERSDPKSPHMRFYANFRNSEVSEGNFLAGASGDGATPSQAVNDYMANISGKRLVIDAYRSTRREIDVPQLTRSRAKITGVARFEC